MNAEATLPGAVRSPSGAVLPAPDGAEPGRYRVRRRVPILPVHSRTIVLRHPETGKVIRDEAGRPRRKTLHCDENVLRSLAGSANDLSARGHDLPITLGHIQLYEPDEDKQPETVGFMRNYGVGPITDGAGHVTDPTPHLYTDLHIDTDRYDEAMSYPHRSTEIDPDFSEPANSTLDSLALLRRHPEHRMGLLRNERDPADDPAEPTEAETVAEPQAPAGEEEPMADEMTPSANPADAIVQAIIAAAPQIVQAMLGALPAEEAPDEAPPVQNADAMPSGDDTFAPGMLPEDETEEQNCDGDQKMQYQRDHQALVNEINRLRSENAAMNRRLEENEDYVGEIVVQNARNSVAKSLDELEAEGIDFDRSAEAEELLSLDTSGRDRHIARMRLQYRRSPINRGFVDAASPRGKVRGVKTEDERDAIVAIASKKGISFTEAKEAFFASKV